MSTEEVDTMSEPDQESDQDLDESLPDPPEESIASDEDGAEGEETSDPTQELDGSPDEGKTSDEEAEMTSEPSTEVVDSPEETKVSAAQVEVEITPEPTKEVIVAPLETKVVTEVAKVKPEPKKPFVGTPPLYPGDLVSFRAKKPYEWTPWYGIVLAPDYPPLQVQNKEKQAVGGVPSALTWNFDEGIRGKIKVSWCHSSRISTVDEKEVRGTCN